MLGSASFISACSRENNAENTLIAHQLRIADSLCFAANKDSAIKVLKNIRPNILASNPLLSSYYCLIAEDLTLNPLQKKRYADSALAVFSTTRLQKKYPDIYYKTLLVNGDACLNTGQYISALNYYYRAKMVLPYATCDDGELAGRMGTIYYQQLNFGLSGKYWAENYNRLGSCGVKFPAEKMFFLKQGALDNAGCAYQKAGILDSAEYYYRKDLAYINKADSDGIIKMKCSASARATLYDNLGGLKLIRGNTTAAKDYIDKCIAIYKNHTGDGALIPPYIKLAQLYLKTGDYINADSAFNKSKVLLDLFSKDNTESLLEWNKSYAAYLLAKNDAAGAYHYQQNYIRLKDSLDKNMEGLYKLDIVRELDGLEQQKTLSDFRQNENFRKVSYAGGMVIVVLFIVILMLISRNLKKSKKNHSDTRLQNEHLQLTLSELELVNKNYIRIMRVMAHDLRNPLSGMTGLAAMLYEEDDVKADSKHMLKLIETTGINSMKMINELLTTGLADDNEKVLMEKVSVTSLLYDSIELLQFKANDKNQQIIFEHEKTPVIAVINHEKIWRVINNLIVNAIKFSHTNGIIKVGITHNDKSLLISVADNGIGIPADQKDAVFEMFTAAKKVGTDGEQPFGLGLSISKRIVEMHNGRIWFEDNKEGGTIFYIELPLFQQ